MASEIRTAALLRTTLTVYNKKGYFLMFRKLRLCHIKHVFNEANFRAENCYHAVRLFNISQKSIFTRTKKEIFQSQIQKAT